MKKNSFRFVPRASSYHQRIVRSFRLLAILPMLLIVLFTILYTVPKQIEKVIELSIANSERVINIIENSTKELNTLTRMLFLRKDGGRNLTYYFEHPLPESDYERLQVNRAVYDVLVELSTFRTDLLGISIHGMNGAYYGYYYSNDYAGLQTMVQADRPLVSEPEVIGAHFMTNGVSQHEVFTILQPLWDARLGKVVATLQMDYDLEIFKSIGNQSSLNIGEELLVINADGDILYSNRREYLDSAIDTDMQRLIKEAENKLTPVTIGKAKYYMLKSELKNPSITIVSLLPIVSIVGDAMTTTFVVLLIMVAIIFLSVYMSSRLSHRQLRPIQEILQAVKQIEKGDFSISIAQQQDVEFNLLVSGLNQMLCTINDLIRQRFMLTLSKKDAELKMLIAQINPHFLDNTLEYISGVAYENDIPQISEMVNALGKMMRYAIKAGDIVTLRDEIIHLDTYLKIHNMRFDHQIKINYDIPDDMMDHQIFKLTLQPIIENSIKYSSEPRTLRLNVAARADGTDWLLLVSDNGPGIAEERLKRIRETISDGTNPNAVIPERQSIGLQNVHSRIVLYYGDAYGMRIENNNDAGITVTIRLPMEGGI